MGYSDRMMTTEAPDLTPGYPNKGAKLGPAWRAAWARLTDVSRSQDPFLEGQSLADEIAPEYGLTPSTLVALFSRAAKAGILDREARLVAGSGGNRARTHYRVKVDV